MHLFGLADRIGTISIPRDEADLLRRSHLRFEQIGFDIGRPEWQDQEEILVPPGEAFARNYRLSTIEGEIFGSRLTPAAAVLRAPEG